MQKMESVVYSTKCSRLVLETVKLEQTESESTVNVYHACQLFIVLQI